MNTITVNGNAMRIKEYQGERVITFADIDKVHQRPNGTTRRNFQTNRKRMVQNQDYYHLSSDEFRTLIGNKGHFYPHGGIVIAESGYLMLVKSLNDKLAWDIQRELVNTYFKAKVLQKVAEAPVVEMVEAAPATIQPIQQQTSEMSGLFDKFMDMQMQVLESERQSNAELRGMIKDLLSYVMQAQNNNSSTVAVSALPKQPKIKQDTDVTLTVDKSLPYEEYKRQIIAAADKVANKHGKYDTRNAVLSECYKRLNAEYSVVFDQEKKEFHNDMGRSPVSTLELIWWIETNKPIYKNLLLCKMNNLYGEA